jgi:signal transduction histidine kinase
MRERGAPGTFAPMRSAHGSTAGGRQQSLLTDLGVSGAFLVAAELEVVLGGLGPDCAALAAVAALALALRRRAPVAAFACVAVLVPALDHALGSPWGQHANALVFMILAASYSLGAHAASRRSLAALLGAVACSVAVEALWGDAEDYGFLLLLFAVPWLSGRGVRGYRRRAERLEALARRLEADRAVSERVAVARERHRMAHEAHDAIAHAVGEMALQASGAEQVLERDPDRAAQALGAVQDTGREAVRELREVLGILRSGDDATGPPEAHGPPAHLAMASAPSRRSWAPALDTLAGAVLLSLGVVYALTDGPWRGGRAAAVLVPVIAAAAVMLHRRRPGPALALALTAYAGEALLAGGAPESPATLGAVLITTYSAAAQAEGRGAALAGVSALGVPAVIALAAGADAADLLLPVAVIGIPWLSGRAVSAYRRQGEALAVLTEQLLREREVRARLAVLEERNRVARELHDSVAHAVSVMVLQAGAAEQILDSDPDRAREAMVAVQAVGRDALQGLGTLLGLLGSGEDEPALSPRPGLAGLDRLLDTVRHAGLPVSLEILGDPQELPAAIDGAAYRVIQEALTNALRHSGAAPTTVTVRYASDGVHLQIVDEGARPPSPTAGGHGLVGMRERVSRQGGDLTAGPRPGGTGFAVTAWLPCTSTADHDLERVHA